jgi:hypothetical protein
MEVQEFSTLTCDLLALSDWLAEGGITHVAMESTGEYWNWSITVGRGCDGVPGQCRAREAGPGA